MKVDGHFLAVDLAWGRELVKIMPKEYCKKFAIVSVTGFVVSYGRMFFIRL